MPSKDIKITVTGTPDILRPLPKILPTKILYSPVWVPTKFWHRGLAKIIKAELAWGYSDHQMFPVMMDMLAQKPEPFLMMLATVDSHLPFDTARMWFSLETAKQRSKRLPPPMMLLEYFGEQFKASKFYDNTIVIAVADHAVFRPESERYFPKTPGK